jgi:uncharacterized protein YndB with AHSA1/START domain
MIQPSPLAAAHRPVHPQGAMTGRDVHLLSRWELAAGPREVYDLVADAASLPRWWPSVFLDATILEPGDTGGVGRVVEVVAAGFLPVTLRWRFRVTAAQPPERLFMETTGDLEGLGLWAFEPAEKRVVVRLHWTGRVAKRGWRHLPTLVTPLLRRSHRWAMERGFTSLLLEVWRRRTTSEEARAWLPRPPRPGFPHNLRRRP